MFQDVVGLPCFFLSGEPVYLIEARIRIYRQYHGKVRSGGIILSFFFCYDIYIRYLLFCCFLLYNELVNTHLFNFYQQ